MSNLQIAPITLKEANDFVKELHRHHKPSVGHKFSIGVRDGERLCGVAIAGRPVARNNDDGFTLEITRVCTDGTKNACSKLYGSLARIAKEMGYKRVITYTLPQEGGSSLKASGWVFIGERGGGNWNSKGRPRQDTPRNLQCKKYLWESLILK